MFGVGGKERRCLQLIKGLIELYGCEIHLVLFDDIIGYPEIKKLDVKIYVLGRKNRKDLSMYSKLVKLINQINPDLVLSWSLMSSFWLNLIHFTRRFNYICAYVANNESPKILSTGNLARLLSFNRAKYVIGNSLIGLKTYKVPIKKSVLIYNGFDNSRLKNLKDADLVRASLSVETKYLVTMVARVDFAKDYQTFIDSARHILTERLDTTFLAVGDGPLLNVYRAKLSLYERKYIKFIGHKQEVEDIINASDICVLCSPSEGISNFILESMALGKPVIATNTGGTPEIIIEGYNGYLVQHKNPIELKNKIFFLLNDENKRIELGRLGETHVHSKFSLERMCEKYFDLFKSFK